MNFFLGLLDAIGGEKWMRRQIHIALQSSQLDGRELVLMREIQNFLPFPRRATQG